MVDRAMDPDMEGGSDSDSDLASAPDRALKIDWNVRRKQHWNSGYREGLEVGKQSTVQKGFDKGYKQGLAAGYRWGVASGLTETLDKLKKEATGLLDHPDPVSGTHVTKYAILDPEKVKESNKGLGEGLLSRLGCLPPDSRRCYEYSMPD